MVINSIILWGASTLKVSCSEFFFETAIKAMNKKFITNYEYISLSELAGAACETNNPDLIWQIAHTETRFRFAIVAFNDNLKSRKILEGKEAIAYLDKHVTKAIKLGIKPPNVDIGPMQINAPSHYRELIDIVKEYKERNKLIIQKSIIRSDNITSYDLISPYVQVAYLVDKMSLNLDTLCNNKWVGCYHSPYNKDLASNYLKNIRKSGYTLKVIAKKIVENEI